MAAVTAVLAHYPEEVITDVTHPVTGLPSKKGWLPTVKEVSDACAEVAEPIAREELRLKQIKEQLEAREMEASGERPTLEQLHKRYGTNWGMDEALPITGKNWAKVPAWGSVVDHYQARPGRIQWLADRLPVLRGEIPDTPEPAHMAKVLVP